jgi:hypothetical protein
MDGDKGRRVPNWPSEGPEDFLKFEQLKKDIYRALPEFHEIKEMFSDLDECAALVFLSYLSFYLRTVVARNGESEAAGTQISAASTVIEESLSGASRWWMGVVYDGFVDLSTDFGASGEFVRSYFGPQLKALWRDWLSFHPNYHITEN